ncbi:hypothetical protein JW898_02080 [Candidatus Woesearchaeota archaeon]|nr:hypothetical protein [Candidatus Woesearchaeota archaeon]
MMCNKCKGTKIKTRVNYSHGRKSKPITIRICMKCGSSDIDLPQTGNRWKRQRR